MEWVETTGRTLEEAKDAALDQLGVAEADAEFEVVEEARSGLFGRLRSEARVRARVAPTTPRPKLDRRDRRRKGPADTGPAAAPAAAGEPAVVAPPAEVAEVAAAARPARAPSRPAEDEPLADMPIEEQGEVARRFVEGLVEAFGATATTELGRGEDDALEVRVHGDDLGLLIGPKGATLTAVQDLARTVLQRAVGEGRGARLRVDVGGYRERRREALERFTRQVAEEVTRTGQARALEAMPPPDRKVVHDTANGIDGITTTSQGEEPHRRVVLAPEGA